MGWFGVKCRQQSLCPGLLLAARLALGHHHHSAGSAGFSISQNSLEQLFFRLPRSAIGKSFQSTVGLRTSSTGIYSASLCSQFHSVLCGLGQRADRQASFPARQTRPALPSFSMLLLPTRPSFRFSSPTCYLSLFRGIFCISVQRRSGKVVSLREQRDEGSRPPPLQN